MKNSKLTELKELNNKLDAIFDTTVIRGTNRTVLEDKDTSTVMLGLLKLREVAVSLIRSEPGIHAEHTHVEHEYLFVISGKLKTLIEGEAYILTPGQFLEIPCNKLHHTEWIETSLVIAITMPANQFFPEGGPTWAEIMELSTNGDD